eukprot:m.101409 g.101409  ORF g.101409 m.101409 type:complete len:118 (+) comp16806_c0_seq5:3478-3831(+)
MQEQNEYMVGGFSPFSSISNDKKPTTKLHCEALRGTYCNDAWHHPVPGCDVRLCHPPFDEHPIIIVCESHRYLGRREVVRIRKSLNACELEPWQRIKRLRKGLFRELFREFRTNARW